MLGWASQQFEKLSQTVAPPPADANGRFVYAVQRGDEDGGMACVCEMDPARAVLNPTKRTYAIHLACENSMDRLIRLLLSQPGVDLTFIDSHGNTPLHYAAMSTDRVRALPTIKMLVTEFKASVVAKNSVGQTPYDLATLDMIRQFLLPLQLQEETRQAIDNGGVGLPPGIDMGGLRIANPAAPPPPIMPHMHAPAPMSSPAPHAYPTPQHDPPKPPTSGQSAGYARKGGSSLAIYKKYADGFHSSSSDVGLQQKYGHTQLQYGNIAPPPSSGNAVSSAFPPPGSGTGGANPYAGGNNPYASGRANQRYVAYDAVTGQTSSMPRAAASPPVYGQPPATATQAPVNYAVFQPGGTAAAAAPVLAPAPASNLYNPASSTSPAAATGGYAASQPYQSPPPHHQTHAAASPQVTPASAYGGNQPYQQAPSSITPVAPYHLQSHAYGSPLAQPAQQSNVACSTVAPSTNGHLSPAQQGFSTYGTQAGGAQPPALTPAAAIRTSPVPTGSGAMLSPISSADSNAAANLFSSPASGGLPRGMSPTPANASSEQQASGFVGSTPPVQSSAGSAANPFPENVAPSGPANKTNDAQPGVSQLTAPQVAGDRVTIASAQPSASVFVVQPVAAIQSSPPPASNNALAVQPQASADFGDKPPSSDAPSGATQLAPAEPGNEVAATSSFTSGGPPATPSTTPSATSVFDAPPTSSQPQPVQSTTVGFGASPAVTQTAPFEPASTAPSATSVFDAAPIGSQPQPAQSVIVGLGASTAMTQTAPIEAASTAPTAISVFGAPSTSSDQPAQSVTGGFGASPAVTQTAPNEAAALSATSFFGTPPSSQPQPGHSGNGGIAASPSVTQRAPIEPASTTPTGTSVFCTPNGEKPAQSGTAGFGTSPAGTQTAPIDLASTAPSATSVFGAPPPSGEQLAQSATGSFGASPAVTQTAPIEASGAAPIVSDVFGAPPTGGEPQPAQSTTGEFGAASAATHSTPFGFSSTAPSATSVFGAPPTSSQPQPAQSGTSGIGASPNVAETAPSARTLFGAPPSSNQAPSLQGQVGSPPQVVATVFTATPGSQSGVIGAPTASSGVDGPPGNMTSPLSGFVGRSGSTSPFPVAPTSGGFSLAEQAANLTAASNLFASPPSQGPDANTTPAPPTSNGFASPVQPSLSQTDTKAVEFLTPAPVQEQCPTTPQVERSSSPAGSDEGLDDVPLSPEVQHQAALGIGQNEGQPGVAAVGFPPPPVSQMPPPAAPAATPGSESLFAAIGMPPPPFSSKR